MCSKSILMMNDNLYTMFVGSRGKISSVSRRGGNGFFSKLSELFRLKKQHKENLHYRSQSDELIESTERKNQTKHGDSIHPTPNSMAEKISKRPENLTIIVSPITSRPLVGKRMNSGKLA